MRLTLLVSPEIEDPPPESEKTLWKYGSAFGKSMVDPRVIATTRGSNASSCWIIHVWVTGTTIGRHVAMKMTTS